MQQIPTPMPLEQNRILQNRDIVCFSHDWTGDPLSKTHLMRLMAKTNRILWINSIGYRAPTVSKADFRRAFRKLAAAMTPVREVEHNIFVFNPLVIPAYGWKTVQWINQALLTMQVRGAMRRLKFKQAINWVFNPTAGTVAGHLNEELIV
jgi:hypothetical protein